MNTAGERAAEGVGQVRYHERLRAPLVWWLLGLLFAASLWLAYQHALGPWVSVPVAAVTFALIAAGIVAYGRVRVCVEATGFAAGRARLPAWAIGTVAALDEEATRRSRGVDLDARAFTLIRGYIPTAVRVEVADPADPVPYWLISTRHPAALAAALRQVKSPPVDPADAGGQVAGT